MTLRAARILGENVKRLRKERGLLQTDLARLSGYSPAMLCGVEQGKEIPSMRQLIRLARKLGVTVSELVEGVR
jgi:transcriptional regulator with XRE-family HTH domain